MERDQGVVNQDVLSRDERRDVERELVVRVRAEDGSFGSQTMSDLLASPMVLGKCRAHVDDRWVTGVLLDWPGYDEPQVLPVSPPLWRALSLTEMPAPPNVGGE